MQPGADSVDAGTVADASTTPVADASSEPSADEKAAFAQFLDDVKTELDATKTPGASVAIVLHGKLAFAAGVGTKGSAGGTSTGDPVTTSTRFNVASLSKMVLAATAMTLVDEGKLDLHAPITKYLPWFKLASGFDASTITMHHLLSHTSGFPCDTVVLCGGGALSGPARTWAEGSPQSLWAAPGAVFDYSNIGFSIASLVVASAAGVSDEAFGQVVQSRVFDRARMATATYDAKLAEVGDYAIGAELNTEGVTTSWWKPTAFDCPLLSAPGGVRATATDYAHFAELLLAKGGGVLSESSAALMMSSLVNMHTFDSRAYGYGLVYQEYPYGKNRPLVWHSGSLPGFLSEIFMVPEMGFAAIVLVNARGKNSVPDTIAAKALPRFVADKQAWPASVKTPPSTWDDYAGVYSDPYGDLGTVTVTIDVPDGGPKVVKVSAPKATNTAGKLTPIEGSMTQGAGMDAWVLPNGEGVTFYRDGSGHVNRLVTRVGIAVRP